MLFAYRNTGTRKSARAQCPARLGRVQWPHSLEHDDAGMECNCWQQAAMHGMEVPDQHMDLIMVSDSGINRADVCCKGSH